MNSILRSLVFLPLSAIALFACAATHDGAAVEDEQSEGTAGAVTKLPAPAVASQRLYFGAPQSAYLTDDAPLSYWLFGAKAGHEFKASVVATSDGHTVDAKPVGFKLYYLLGNRWQLLKSVDGASGEAVFKFIARYDHQYLIEAASGTKPTEIQISVGCAGGDHAACALAQQPGDFCGGIAAGHFKCDAGLFCQFAANTCGAADQGGTCTKPAQICPMIYFPVCGCDGKTYGNSCEATGGKTSVAHDGACAPSCDATKYSLDTRFSVSGTSFKTTDDVISYAFDTSGGVQSTNDPCVHSTCKIKISMQEGTVSGKGGHLTFTYSNGSVASFDVLSNCTGAHRLVGSDWGGNVTVDQR